MMDHPDGDGGTKIEPEIVYRKVPGRGEGAGGVAKNSAQQTKPTLADIQTSRDHVPRELTPKELFEKVALDDAKQNRRLSSKLNGSPSLPLPPSPPFKKVGDSTRESHVESHGPTTRMRFIICTLGLASLAMSQMSRMVLNQTITQMIDPSMLAPKKDSLVDSRQRQIDSTSGRSSDGSCPWPEPEKSELWVDDAATTLFPPFTTTMAPSEETTTQPPPPPPPPPPATSGGDGDSVNTTPPTTLRPVTTFRPVPGEEGAATSPASGVMRLQIEIQPEEELPRLMNESPPERPTTERPIRQNTDDNLNELPDFEEHEGTTTRPSAELSGVPTERSSESSDGGITQVFEIVTEGDTETAKPGDNDEEEAETPEPTIPVPNANGTDQHWPQQQSRYPVYRWTMQQQNTLLGGFYYSYFVFMVLGGRMAEIYGAKYVLLLSVGGSALINLATPWMASTSFTLLVMSRVVMGAIQSGVFPGMYALIAKWLTMTEASIYAPLIKMNLRLGMVLGSLIPGLTSGWPSVFYLTGVLSIVWSILWVAVATSDPADNRWVSRAELTHINRKKKAPGPSKPVVEVEMGARGPGMHGATPEEKRLKKSTPWVKILTAPSVIGLIIVKLTFNYALDFLAIELPSYLALVHHASKVTVSGITSFMFGIQVILIVFVGWLAKITVQRRPLGLDKTGIRKLFQGLASFGLAASFFLLTFNDCNLTYVTILLQIISFLSMFTAGGETMLPYDLSLEYPATIMAIANSVANLSGVTTTTLTGLVLGTQGGSYYRWNILIYLIAGANLLGGLAFTLLVKAEPIDFSDDHDHDDDHAETTKRRARRDTGDIEAAKMTAATKTK